MSSHLFTTQHPRAFLIVQKALSKENHYLLQCIDNHGSGYGSHVQQDTEFSLLGEGDSESKEKSRQSLLSEQRIVNDLMRKELDIERTEKESLRSSNKALKEELDKEKAKLEKLRQELVTTKTNSEIQISKLYQIQKLKQEQIEEQLIIVREEEKQSEKFRYQLDPVLIQTIEPKADEQEKLSITGLTILDKELFLVSDHRSEVEIYNSMEFSFNRRWNLKELIDPFDIASCTRNKCLYIFDVKDDDEFKEILRIDTNGKLMNKWLTGDDFGRLSVTNEGNLILTRSIKVKLTEYSPDGQFIREIDLSSVAGIRHPIHAIKLSNGQFVVSHGINDDGLHRVCLVDAEGKLVKSFGGKRGSNIGQMNRPLHLSVDGNGFVMVAESRNRRVLLLDHNLGFKRDIISNEGKFGLRCPNRIFLDESNGRLFVADNKLDTEKKQSTDGRTLIFDFK